ncbi:MAG: hypothetical protein ACHP65_01030 [Legionellales bacterium]
MPLSLPEFSELRVSTLNLDMRLSILLGRYTIVINPVVSAAAAASNSASSLEVLLERTSQVVLCETKRVGPRDVFKTLVAELKKIPPDNEEQVKQGTLLLLGALLHRYFRILQEYDGYNNFSFWSSYNPLNSVLLQAIRAALQLDPKLELDAFRQADLKQLDVVTIVTSLEVFKNSMLLAGESKTPRYMNYLHFAQDVNFKTYLQNIIAQHVAVDKKSGDSLLSQFAAIRFIESLAKHLDSECLSLDRTLDAWCDGLLKDYPDFSKLDSDAVEAHINSHIGSELLKRSILALLNTDYVQDKFSERDHASFLSAMKQCCYNKASFIVFGGYALLLQSDAVHENLKHCIYQALGFGADAIVLTGEETIMGITCLKHLLETEPSVDLDCQFFGGKGKLRTEISQIEKSIVGGIQPQLSPVNE